MDYVLAGSLLDQFPARLIGGSDPLGCSLKENYSIEMIAPNQRNRSRNPETEGRRNHPVNCFPVAWLSSRTFIITRFEHGSTASK